MPVDKEVTLKTLNNHFGSDLRIEEGGDLPKSGIRFTGIIDKELENVQTTLELVTTRSEALNTERH